MACLYLLGRCDYNFGRQFSEFHFDLQRKNSGHYSLLIDMFGKTEMQMKR